MLKYAEILKPIKKILRLDKEYYNKIELLGKKHNSETTKSFSKKLFFKDYYGQKYCLRILPLINENNELENFLVLERILEKNLKEEVGLLCLLKKNSLSYSIRDYKLEDILNNLESGCDFYCITYGEKEKDILGPFRIREIIYE
ncbi:MAG: hypothetical protein QXU20_03040 [Candidatus Woesearchaeota archaeon]